MISLSENHKLARGVLLLTVSNLVVKACGLLFKIPLTALIGEEGMGYFNSAYTLFTYFYMLSTAGLPVVMSMSISRAAASNKGAAVKKIFRVGLSIFLVLGLVGSAGMILGAGFFASLMKVEKSRLAIIAIAPTLFFICQSAALRGCFQGFGDMRPHAISQLAEAVGKVALGVALAYRAVQMGESAEVAAAHAAFGLTVGIAAGMLVLYIAKLCVKPALPTDDIPEPTSVIAKSLVKTAVPITLASSVMSLANLLDTLIMTRRLHDIGLSQAETVAIYGNYSSLAVPMFNLPPVLVYPIAYALVPMLSALLEKRDIDGARKLCRAAVRVTSLIAMPCAAGMSVLSKPILSLFFADDVAERGAMMLSVLAPSSYLICILAITNTVLQTCGRERLPLWAMLAGGGVKLATSWLLIPMLGKYGTPVSTFLCYLVILVISAWGIAAKTELGDIFACGGLLLPLTASLLSATAAALIYGFTSMTIPAIVGAVLVYGLLMLIGYRPGEEEVGLIPGGQRLMLILRKKCKYEQTESRKS